MVPSISTTTATAWAVGLLLVGGLTLARPVMAQQTSGELPRRVMLGAKLVPVHQATARAAGLPDTLGAAVPEVIPNSPAVRMGLQAGDVVRAVNGQPITGVPDFMGRVRAAHAGDQWTLTVRRAKKDVKLKGRLEGRPLETNPGFAIKYETVRLPDGVRRRSLVAVPPGAGRKPAILFMGGVGCYSLDGPAGVVGTYGQLLNGLTEAGFITCRVEKSGVGDSEGAPCQTVDFATEVAGYRAALAALRTRPDVDPDRVYLLGHSIGGLIVPVLATETPVRGAIAIETAGYPWYEYVLLNARRQLPMEGIPPTELDAAMRDAIQANYAFYFEHQSVAAIAAKHPGWQQHIILPMSEDYMHQVGDLNPMALWTKAARPALLVAGGSDFVTNPAEHRAIADALNQLKPGLGSFVEVPDMDHTLGRAATVTEARDRMNQPGTPPTPFHPAVLDVVLKWLHAHQG